MNDVLTKNTINNVAKTIFLSVIFSCVFVIFINHVISIGLHELYILNGKNTIHELIATLVILKSNNPLNDLILNTVPLFYYHSIQLHSLIIDFSAVIVAMLIFDTLVALIKKRDIRPSKITLGLSALTIYLYVTASLIVEPITALSVMYLFSFIAWLCWVIGVKERTFETLVIFYASFIFMCYFFNEVERDIREQDMSTAWKNTSNEEIYNSLIIKSPAKNKEFKNK